MLNFAVGNIFVKLLASIFSAFQKMTS